MKFKSLLNLILATACACLAGAASPAAAQYPDRAIKMIVAFPPGGGTDMLARLVGAELGRELGQSIVILNRGGAAGSIGTLAAARADPDGYTILLATSNVTITPAVDKSAKFSALRDFKPVTLLTESPFALVVSPALKIKTLPALVAYSAKHKGSINFASTGVGSLQQLTTELFKQQNGLDWMHVPYQGGGPALNGLLEGQVQVMFSNVLPVLPFLQTGRLLALAQTTSKRLPILPNVPTMAEAGYGNFTANFWSGILVPKKTPDTVVSVLDAALRKVMQKPEIQQRLISEGTMINVLDSQSFKTYIMNDQTHWKDVAKATHISISH
ncbi:Bug family tripartite tricarboxylate transporter substrate binding protein [Candidimonas nitroreducens]|uniref:LacI family transcriptional regulator n=1 Tax=Candidimonas nitroreducens TaxID=683354 RepID=A0A225M8N0_9BURK|nr:tripartite tricarboxylate transporter substrate binding protein [Candidimonas nitroreducens]OWT57638.1 hypothetical protein CEY11_17285 [Candidimonas nitroreducens]